MGGSALDWKRNNIMPSKTHKMAKFMAACAHGADYEECPPKGVAKEFNQADKKTGMLKKTMESVSSKTKASEWETRHDEFVKKGDEATDKHINKVVYDLEDFAKYAEGKKGLMNSVFGKKSNSELGTYAHSALVLSKNIERLRPYNKGTEERKELGQQLIYGETLLRKMNESVDTEIPSTLIEGKVKEIASEIGGFLDGAIAKYNKMGGAEVLADKAASTSTKIAKQFGISKEAATKFVNDYVDSEIEKHSDKFRKDAETNPSRFKKDYDDVKEGVLIPKGVKSFFKNVDRVAKGKDLDSRVKQEIGKSLDATMTGDHKIAGKHFKRFDKLDTLKSKTKDSGKNLTESEDVYKLVDANKWHLIQNDKLLVANLFSEHQAKEFHGGHGYGKETKVMHGTQVRRNPYLKKSSTGFINWPDYKNDVKESKDGEADMVTENKWYEMMLSSSNVKRFQAKDNEEAKVLARKSKAKSLIRCTRDGMPVGKIGNNLLKESTSFKQYLFEEPEIEMWTADSGDYDVQHPERFHTIGNYASNEEAQAALAKCKNKGIMGSIHKRKGPASWLKKGPQ